MLRIQTGGNAVAEKRVAESVTGRDRIFRWKCLLNGNSGNDAKMKVNIPIGTLASVQTVFLYQQSMGREHISKKNKGGAAQDQKYPVLF